MSTGGRYPSLNCLSDCEYHRITYRLVYANVPRSFFIDTWTYFLHRASHANKFLYKTLHSWHHRLYVSYSYGALYSNPIEGFLDSCSAVAAERLTGMSIRQTTLLFIIAIFKTVDDHCGYSFPFDPLRLFTSNNSDYHDIHHQVPALHEVVLVCRVLNPTVGYRSQVKLLNGFRVLGCPARYSDYKRRDRGPKTTQGC